MRRNYNTRLILRTDKERKKDNTCPVYIEITLNGKRFVKLSTGERGKREDWNLNTQSFNGKGFGLLNKTLNKIVYDLEEYIEKEKSRGDFVTVEMIKSYFNKEDTECYFYYFDETFYKSRLTNLTKSTRDKYLLLRRRLKEFRPKLRLSEIDLKFLLDFRNFLTYDKNVGIGAIWNAEKNFRATVKLAYDLGMIEKYAFSQFKLKTPKCKNEALNLDELKKIVEVDLKGNKRLEETRDHFLFSCYTGLRFGDVKSLKWSSVNRGVIKIIQEKTKNPVSVPLNKEAVKIIAKYVKEKREREFVFRVISNQKTNFILKGITKLAKIEKNVTFHMARHTFGTILARTENAFTIAKLMGHKKISTSMVYVNTDETTLKERMKNVSFEK